MGAMLEMMEQMMGKKPTQKPSETNQGGEGSTAQSDSPNTKNTGSQKKQNQGERRIPRASGKAGAKLPPEFQNTLDGYNRTRANP